TPGHPSGGPDLPRAQGVRPLAILGPPPRAGLRPAHRPARLDPHPPRGSVPVELDLGVRVGSGRASGGRPPPVSGGPRSPARGETPPARPDRPLREQTLSDQGPNGGGSRRNSSKSARAVATGVLDRIHRPRSRARSTTPFSRSCPKSL